MEIVGRNEGKDGGSGVGCPVHIANMNFVERSFADAEHERTFFFKADIGGALDQVRSDAAGNTGERSDAAWQDDHRVSRIRAAGDVGANV